MSMNVKFLAGLKASYLALESRAATTFYFLTDSKEFYLGDVKLDNTAVLALIGTLPEGYADV